MKQFEKKSVKYAKLVGIGDKADKQRQIKTADEIEKIRQAEMIGDRAFARLMLDFGVESDVLGEVGARVAKYHEITPLIATKTTEKQVAARLEFYLKDEGGEKLSFETIAASGENGAKPHAVPSDKLLRTGEMLTLDFGCVYQGYCSDMTRTVSVGKPKADIKKIYEIVKKAQQIALDKLKPGMKGSEIDALARDYIKEKGYGKSFGHSLGHSVGLKIHERPGFSAKEKTVIETGMVVSVEPGIYVEGIGGVRIEDLVAVTDRGADILGRSVRDIIMI